MGAGKRTITSMALTVLLAFLALAGATSVEASSEIHLRQHYQGVILQAMTPLPGKSFDTSVLGAEAGLARIRSALDRLISGSPHSARRLRRLLENGRVFLITVRAISRMTMVVKTLQLSCPITASNRPRTMRERIFVSLSAGTA